MNQKKGLVCCAVSALLAWSGPGSADACQSMTGSWTATYSIISTFTDTFEVQSVAKNGAVRGVTEFGDAMTGWCKKGVMYLVEQSTNFYSAGYYFNSTGQFGRHSGTSKIGSHTYDVGWYAATMAHGGNVSRALTNTPSNADALRWQKAEESIEEAMTHQE